MWRRKINEFKKYTEALISARNHNVKGFILYGFGRSGSTLLTSLINSHPQIICDSEIFHRNRVGNIFFPMWYLNGNQQAKTVHKEKKMYGCGIMSYQLHEQKYIDHKKFIHLLRERGWKFLHLRRRSVLDIALSIVKAEMDGVYEVKGSTGYEAGKVIIPIERLNYYLGSVTFHHRNEDAVMSEVDHFSIVYEDHLLNKDWNKTLKPMFEFLGQSPISVNSTFKKKSKTDPQEQFENYDEIIDCYQKFLESQ